MSLIIKLLIAHLLGDFILQPKAWVDERAEKKIRSPFLYVHVAVHFVLALLAGGIVNFWIPAFIISISHLIIDIVKAYLGKRSIWFFVDQFLHLMVLFIAWYYLDRPNIDFSLLYDDKVLLIALALLSVTKPTSVLIQQIIARWQGKLAQDSIGALENAGEVIGVIERILTVCMILAGQWTAIGFIIASKSVFRFGDLRQANDRKLTEYILTGTLLSFGIAIVVGLITNHFLSDLP